MKDSPEECPTTRGSKASSKVSGVDRGQRRLNGPQTTGRDYRDLSEPSFEVRRTNNVAIAVRDGTSLMADLFQPNADGRFPVLLSFSPYPRQIQDLGGPLFAIEAGAPDFWATSSDYLRRRPVSRCPNGRSCSVTTRCPGRQVRLCVVPFGVGKIRRPRFSHAC